jgi:hypothetical protein
MEYFLLLHYNNVCTNAPPRNAYTYIASLVQLSAIWLKELTPRLLYSSSYRATIPFRIPIQCGDEYQFWTEYF